MKKKFIFTAIIIAVLTFSLAMVVGAESFTLTSDAGDKKAGDTVSLWDDGGNALVWYVNDEAKLVSQRAIDLTVEFLAQDQPYTQVGRLPAVSGADSISAIKLGDTELQSQNGQKRLVVANLQDLSFAYIYSSNSTTLFTNSTGLQAIYLPDTVKRLAEGSFMGCTNLTYIDMGDSVQIVWNKVFQGASSIERIDFSNTTLYVGENVFYGCSSLNEVHFGSSMQHFPQYFMKGTGNQQIDVYLPTTITNFGAPYNNFLTIFFTGTEEQAKAQLPTFGVVNYTFLPYSEFDGTRTTVALKWYAYYDTSECDAFYKGEHKGTDDNDCTTSLLCDVCGATMESSLSSHMLGEVWEYSNGYAQNGTHKVGCTRTGCDYGTTSELFPLFVNKGYTKEEGANGSSIAYGIQIDRTAIATYENATGKKVSYGFIVGSAPENATGDIINSKGESLLKNTVAVDLAAVEQQTFTIYNIKLTDIKTDAQKALRIYCNAYIIVNEQVSYIGEAETEKAVAVTYNNLPVKKEN